MRQDERHDCEEHEPDGSGLPDSRGGVGASSRLRQSGPHESRHDAGDPDPERRVVALVHAESGIHVTVDEVFLRHEHGDCHCARAPATKSARAGHRLGVSTRNATTRLQPREGSTGRGRYMTAARIGSGNAARTLASRERRETMIESSSG